MDNTKSRRVIIVKAVIELKSISKSIRGKKIIDNLSLQIYAGEVFGLLGPNGAGKTTTIRMMTGLMRVTEGEILINGKNLSKDFENAISQIGAIVENPELYKDLTGYQNLMQVARITKGVTKKEINELIDFVGLKDRIHDKVKTYSLGMRQRLGIALCLIHKPKILILDEPTNGLDPAGIREIRDHLRHLAKERNMAIIVSSHLLSEMEMMCDRIAIIQKGKLINVQHVRTDNEVEIRPYSLEVDNIQLAEQILSSSGYKVSKKENLLEMELEKQQVPLIIKTLVNENIQIYEIKAFTKSLEDRFLEITSDKEVEAHA